MFKNQNELIKQLTDKQIVQNLYFTQLLLICFSFVLGIFLFHDVYEFFQLFLKRDLQFIYYGIGTALFVIIVDFIIFKLAPKNLVDDGGINEKIFQKRSVPHIIFLTALIAVSEEILFRGVIQTHFGLWIASLIFAVLHFRYLSKWLLFIMVISISFLLGVVYEITENLYTTILAHFLIDLIFAIQIRVQYVRGENI
ncbi:CPBP family intramembrane glutamic endopeptidase [Metabacillus halosaccharovorans]|uniref:CPBP family intramembrane metalloprotease n=1 Tax=Metabacillus halosaccharovorans TaxID=930124 RepID=A0ABT3DMM2_9BACI|nr:CPBP family intramembrane glutamic endopeptidase [Metabacillus halosaccharovorans]MCV9888314.1 CPBP family intramembrane metalloprotease [Metabacillus halosaccharovorans]